jgi:Thioredoxin
VLTVEPALIEKYVRPGKLRLVFRDVLNHGERSDRASEAAACAGRQGKFWEMHAALFENMNDTWAAGTSEALLTLMTKRASEIDGIDASVFAHCLEMRETLAQLQAADAEQRGRGINVQPVFEIGDERIVGGRSFEVFAKLIDACYASALPLSLIARTTFTVIKSARPITKKIKTDKIAGRTLPYSAFTAAKTNGPSQEVPRSLIS